MAIQFQCPACSQPIEIDPEWGGRPVVCPYCRKTVTAPPESTYAPPAQTPVARPSSAVTTFEVISAAPAVPDYGPPLGGNLIALWSMILALSSLACLVAGNLIIYAHWTEIEPLVRLREDGKSYQELNAAFLEHFHGTPPGWLIGVALVMFMSFALWAAAVVCGLIGARRQPRRNFAIAGLAVSGLMVLLALAGRL